MPDPRFEIVQADVSASATGVFRIRGGLSSIHSSRGAIHSSHGALVEIEELDDNYGLVGRFVSLLLGMMPLQPCTTQSYVAARFTCRSDTQRRLGLGQSFRLA
jgi:hypothetical protein